MVVVGTTLEMETFGDALWPELVGQAVVSLFTGDRLALGRLWNENLAR